MVTSNKQPDKKVVKMAEQNSAAVVPQRTLLGEVNEHITCPLCRGYYIDATTIVECLHSFCRSCIIKHLRAKSYCPVCEMMINSAKPNIKLDKALQDIVYKLVPGLFQKEMERRQQFYSSRPGPAASATPEQRGEDTERIIFSPEDVISFSLEYADATDTDSISSKSSDSNELQPVSATPRRFLQCPAVVNISHLKKFLSMKFDIDSTQFAIDILYKRVPLPDYYTLMDIAYIYNWKRNEPMRFFYQITDYIAIRNRLFEINRKGSASCHLRDRKSSPASTEDTNASSPAPHLNDQGSEASSGTDSPMPDDGVSHASDMSKNNEKTGQQAKELVRTINPDKHSDSSSKKNDDEVEKSQFLNSFELTAKSMLPLKSSPVKCPDEQSTSNDAPSKNQTNTTKVEEKVGEPSKRKYQATPHTPELKKLKIELEKAKISHLINPCVSNASPASQSIKTMDTAVKGKELEGSPKNSQVPPVTPNVPSPIPVPTKDIKQQMAGTKLQESPGVKRAVSVPQNISSPKRKPPNELPSSVHPHTGTQKTISPLKLQIPKTEVTANSKPHEVQKPAVKKMPDLKPSVPMSNKGQPVNKVRMDLLANNSDPTIDRSKILSQVKSSLGSPITGTQPSGDPLKSLFDSCKINIPSSLSITLTDQKLDTRNPGETANPDPKKSMVNKNLAGASHTTHKVPSPPVHNYIEILKLPDTETKKQKSESNNETKSGQPSKTDNIPASSKPPTKSSESSAKGPVPNLKPISDTKLGKVPITFQQTFEQQLQSLNCDKKSKLPKNKAQVPKLVPATPKSFNAANKSNNPVNKSSTNNMPALEPKPSTALDLSTPHNLQNQLAQQQTFHKAFETMQSIDNLAKKQNLPTKSMPLTMPQSNVFPSSITNRPLSSGVSPLRIPSTANMNQLKLDKGGPGGSQMNNRQDMASSKPNPMKPTGGSPSVASPGSHIAPHTPPSAAQPSPRSQTRSPSSSPKLVIAEEKQAGSSAPEPNINQSNQITSTQIPNMNSANSDLSKASPGPSKPGLKPMPASGKLPGIRQPLPTTQKTNPTMNASADYRMSQTRPQLMPHHQVLLRHQMEVNAWLEAKRQIDLYKSITTNMAHQNQNDFNSKDKQ
ncbi:hypothetical protein PYW07_000951 [Mythimna separata]|uniref:RING-type domain-containing protein n=1 Tax=Mythimna separata TaxID=271217 RepID=A0AAD7YU21_MYTSE|nr:hypothetical protein PYW07_000951 [Mythimna separata]